MAHRRVDNVAAWKAKALAVAEKLVAGNRHAEPVTTAELDQILATVRDAGLSEREQGVFLVKLLDADLHRKGWTKKMDDGHRIVIATALAMRILDSGRL